MRFVWVVLAAVALSGCGVPREAGGLARREAAVRGAAAADDAAVRAALAGQAEAWEALAGMARRREVLGVAVGADFVALVDQAAALARRQGELIAAGEDEAALNREALERMRKLWGEVERYLGN